MTRYIAKRILYMIPVLLGVTLLVFFIMHLAPGNVAAMILGENATKEQIAALEAEMGLDRPLLIQYLDYLLGLLHGDLGTSYTTGASVTSEIMARFPYTVVLTLVAAVVSILLALPLGILAAVKQNTWVDNVSMVVSLIGVSMPIFWLAVMLILFFSLKLGWFPVYGANSWDSIVLPAISLGFMNMASIARTTRSSMVETIRAGLHPDRVRQGPVQGNDYHAPCVPQRHAAHHHRHRPGDRPDAGRLRADGDGVRLARRGAADDPVHQRTGYAHGHGLHHSHDHLLLFCEPDC